MSGEQATYTPKQAAAIWEVSDQTVYRLIASGEVRAERKRVGLSRKRYQIPASEVRRIRALLDNGQPGNKQPQPIAA
jgi:excisionase family DNA binding protein